MRSVSRRIRARRCGRWNRRPRGLSGGCRSGRWRVNGTARRGQGSRKRLRGGSRRRRRSRRNGRDWRRSLRSCRRSWMDCVRGARRCSRRRRRLPLRWRAWKRGGAMRRRTFEQTWRMAEDTARGLRQIEQQMDAAGAEKEGANRRRRNLERSMDCWRRRGRAR